MRSTHTLLTLGYGRYPCENLLAMLKAAAVACLINVRSDPNASHDPNLSQDMLRNILNTAQIT